MKCLVVFLHVLHLRRDASPSQGYPWAALSLLVPIYHLGGERPCESKVLAQEQNTMSRGWTPTRTNRSGAKRTNHEATLINCPSIVTFIIVYNKLFQELASKTTTEICYSLWERKKAIFLQNFVSVLTTWVCWVWRFQNFSLCLSECG